MKPMKQVGLVFGALGALGLAGLGGLALGCNGLLGIQSATVGDLDAGAPVEAGVSCAYYCQTITQNCTGADDTEYQGDLNLCLTMCNALPSDTGFLTDTSGNTLGCRIHYAQLAASDPGTNCRFAGPLGGGQCGAKSDACTNFCALDVPYCLSVKTPAYLTQNDCTTQCLTGGDAGTGYLFVTDGGANTQGVDLPDGTNTLNCRFYHLENAYPSADRGHTHCPHTMPISATCY